ncbi:hypothetical protein ACFVGX_24350 [Streptomyces sp. NPDC127113]|uniref:hypothetical protein n=1 Tax=Streptomyces sp. NPDC127113 TaxID=3345365 RepID=UPI00363D21C0
MNFAGHVVRPLGLVQESCDRQVEGEAIDDVPCVSVLAKASSHAAVWSGPPRRSWRACHEFCWLRITFLMAFA